MELSILCDCEIALFIHTPHNNKFVKYVSSNLDSILTQLKTHESEKILTNNDVRILFSGFIHSFFFFIT